jgi:hypothetical protein
VWNGKNFSVVLSIIVTLVTPSFSAQQWSIVCYPDYYIELANFWNEEEKELEIVVTIPDQNSSFSARLIVSGNNPKGVHFPFDFAPQRIDSNLLDHATNISITAYSKSRKIAYLETLYDPAENIGMQLQLATISANMLQKLSIGGTLIDKYIWMDKSGENLIIRSNLTHSIIQKENTLYRHYIYLYHFRKNESIDSWEAVRKYTDVVSLCKQSVFQPFDLSFLYLTDINKDGMAEINFRYAMNCPINDSLSPIVKTVLVTDGKRYTTTLNYAVEEATPLTISLPYMHDPVFERYIKRIALNYH